MDVLWHDLNYFHLLFPFHECFWWNNHCQQDYIMFNHRPEAKGMVVAGAQAMAQSCSGQDLGKQKCWSKGWWGAHLSCPGTQLRTEASWSGDRLPPWGHYVLLPGYQLCCHHWAPPPPSSLSVSNSLFKITTQIYICGWIFLSWCFHFSPCFFFSFFTVQLSFLFFVLGEIINNSGMEGKKNCRQNVSLLGF